MRLQSIPDSPGRRWRDPQRYVSSARGTLSRDSDDIEQTEDLAEGVGCPLNILFASSLAPCVQPLAVGVSPRSPYAGPISSL
jgi:hypothetical protein